jgi:hypothetical protein
MCPRVDVVIVAGSLPRPASQHVMIATSQSRTMSTS